MYSIYVLFNFIPTCTIFIYPTFYEYDFKIPTHPVNLLFVYLSPKQVVVLHSVRLFVVSTMVTTRSISVTTNMVSKKDVEDKDDENMNKSPDALKKVGDKMRPYTDATRPLSTPKLARQAEDLQAHPSVFPNGH